MIPDEAVEAAARGLAVHTDRFFGEHLDGKDRDEWTRRIIEASAPHMLASATALIRALTDPDECWFDHHGGCQAHGYDLQPGEKCPQALAKEWAQ